MAKIIAIANTKGGAGKTTVAENVGIYYAMSGKSTVLINADTQKTLDRFMESRAELGVDWPDYVKASDSNDLESSISTLNEAGYEIIMIDTQGAFTAVTSKACELSDIIVVPIPPEPTELRDLEDTIEMLGEHGDRAMYILNKCAPNLGAKSQADIADLLAALYEIEIESVKISRLALTGTVTQHGIALVELITLTSAQLKKNAKERKRLKDTPQLKVEEAQKSSTRKGQVEFHSLCDLITSRLNSGKN